MARLAIVAALLACGPTIDVVDDGGDDSTGEATTSTSTTAGASTSIGVTTSTSTTQGSSSDEGSTTSACSCEGSPIELTDEVDEGFTPAELLEMMAFLDATWTWDGIAASPETTAAAAAHYVGGEVLDEPGGGCDFWPCPAGVTISRIRISVATADGRLADDFHGWVRGEENAGLLFWFYSDSLPLAALEGTLADDAFEDDDGRPFLPSSVRLELVWQYENGALTLDSSYLRGEGGVIGSHQPR